MARDWVNMCIWGGLIMSSAVRREWDTRGVDVGVDVGVCYQAATSQARETRTRRARLSRGLHLHSPAEYVIPIWVVDYLRNIQILHELVLEYSAGIWGSEAQWLLMAPNFRPSYLVWCRIFTCRPPAVRRASGCRRLSRLHRSFDWTLP